MKKIAQNRLTILKADGTWGDYPIKIGENHQECIDKFCKKENYPYSNIETIVQNNNCVFYNINNGIVVVFLPKNITENQYFELDLASLYMNEITYMEARIQGKKEDFIFNEQIGENFSTKVIQYYFEQKKEDQSSIKHQ